MTEFATKSDGLPDLPAGARWATEQEVNALEPRGYFDGVAFDLGEGESSHIIFPDAQSREDFVANLNDRQPRDMTTNTNW